MTTAQLTAGAYAEGAHSPAPHAAMHEARQVVIPSEQAASAHSHMTDDEREAAILRAGKAMQAW